MDEQFDGAEAQTWNAQNYSRNARFVADLAGDLLIALNAKEKERILDLGCGDGVLSACISAMGATVVGVDSSQDLLEAARARGIDARYMDGQKLTFASEFDAVFSNAALHWMLDARAVIKGVKRSLIPGGRFVAEFGGHGNVAAISTALIAVLNHHGIDGAARFPWFFPTVSFYTSLLKEEGFVVKSIQLIPRPTPLPGSMVDWLATFANPFMRGFDEKVRLKILEEVTTLLSASLKDEQGNWTADYVRLRFEAAI